MIFLERLKVIRITSLSYSGYVTFFLSSLVHRSEEHKTDTHMIFPGHVTLIVMIINHWKIDFSITLSIYPVITYL